MKQELIDNNPILKLSFEFALLVIDYTERLEELKWYNLANQLFRAGHIHWGNCHGSAKR
jgi:hypothetical protein